MTTAEAIVAVYLSLCCGAVGAWLFSTLRRRDRWQQDGADAEHFIAEMHGTAWQGDVASVVFRDEHAGPREYRALACEAAEMAYRLEAQDESHCGGAR